MRHSILVIFGLAFISCYSVFVFAEDSIKTVGITIQSLEACRVDYTEIGRRASFSGSVFYRSVVNDDGVVSALNPVTGKEFLSRFVQLEQFESCVRRWRFQDPGEYFFQFSAGTRGERLRKWEIKVTAKGKALTVIL